MRRMLSGRWSAASGSVGSRAAASSTRKRALPPLRACSSSARASPTMARAACRSKGSSVSVTVVPGSAMPSSARVAATTSTRSPARWTGACDNQRAVAASARCASSTIRTTGCRRARRRTAPVTAPWRMPWPRAGSTSAARGAGPVAAVCVPNRGASTGASGPRTASRPPDRGSCASAATRSSRGCRGRAWPNSSQATEATLTAGAARASAHTRSSRVFPMPASPSTAHRMQRPAAASSNSTSSWRRAFSRPGSSARALAASGSVAPGGASAGPGSPPRRIRVWSSSVSASGPAPRSSARSARKRGGRCERGRGTARAGQRGKE